jgi:Transposase IS116/IS110/IS902 family
VLTGEPFRESVEDYTRLLERLHEDLDPVGALEEVLVERLAFELLRVGRLYKADVQVAPRVFKQLEAELKKNAPSAFNLDDKVGETIVIRRELASELLLRYGNAVSNQIHRILDRLERLQRMRRGQPVEYSSGGRQQRLGHISKQGNPFLRGLLVEAAQSAVQHEPEMRRAYQRLAQRKCRGLAKVAMARKLAVRLYWMLRLQVNYAQLIQGSHAGQPGTFRGRG